MWRDFWREWREERHRLWEEQEPIDWDPEASGGMPSSRERAHAWREFFHEFMGTWPEHHWAFGGRSFNPWHQGIDTFNPFVSRLLSKGGGLLPLYVMHLLSQQPRYGNELMDLLTERTRGRWITNPGAIYPLMTMLEEQGLVAGEWEDPTKRTVRVYSLTEAGQREMMRLKAIVCPKLEEAIEVLQDLMSDLDNEASESEQPGISDEINE